MCDDLSCHRKSMETLLLSKAQELRTAIRFRLDPELRSAEHIMECYQRLAVVVLESASSIIESGAPESRIFDLAVKEARKANFRNRVAKQKIVELDEDLEYAEDEDKVENRAELHNLYISLTEEEKRLFYLKWVCGCTNREIGHELRKSEGAIKAQIHRLRKKISKNGFK